MTGRVYLVHVIDVALGGFDYYSHFHLPLPRSLNFLGKLCRSAAQPYYLTLLTLGDKFTYHYAIVRTDAIESQDETIH